LKGAQKKKEKRFITKVVEKGKKRLKRIRGAQPPGSMEGKKSPGSPPQKRGGQ